MRAERYPMKLSRTVLCVLAVCLCVPLVATAEQKPSPLLGALRSTTITGYIYTSSHWQLHVCNGIRRNSLADRLNHLVRHRGRYARGFYGRCRHGLVFIPARQLRTLAGAFPWPRPPLPSRVIRTTPPLPLTPEELMLLMEANRMPNAQGRSGRSLPPMPPLPPPSIITTPPQ